MWRFRFRITTFDLIGDRPFILGLNAFPFWLFLLIWAPFSLNEPAPDLLVCANFLPATLAFCCLFFLIFADLTGSVFWKQVDGFATIRPFLGPDEHLNPALGFPPFCRLKIWLTPSVIAEWSGCSSIVPSKFSGTISCGTISCVGWPLMALDVVALDLVSFWFLGTTMNSLIFILVFIVLMRSCWCLCWCWCLN